MLYKRGDYGISIEQIDGFGKRPGLWIRHGYTMVKMASFGSEEKAKIFKQYLDYLLTNEKEPDCDAN